MVVASRVRFIGVASAIAAIIVIGAVGVAVTDHDRSKPEWGRIAELAGRRDRPLDRFDRMVELGRRVPFRDPYSPADAHQPEMRTALDALIEWAAHDDGIRIPSADGKDDGFAVFSLQRLAVASATAGDSPQLAAAIALANREIEDGCLVQINVGLSVLEQATALAASLGTSSQSWPLARPSMIRLLAQEALVMRGVFLGNRSEQLGEYEDIIYWWFAGATADESSATTLARLRANAWRSDATGSMALLVTKIDHRLAELRSARASH